MRGGSGISLSLLEPEYISDLSLAAAGFGLSSFLSLWRPNRLCVSGKRPGTGHIGKGGVVAPASGVRKGRKLGVGTGMELVREILGSLIMTECWPGFLCFRCMAFTTSGFCRLVMMQSLTKLKKMLESVKKFVSSILSLSGLIFIRIFSVSQSCGRCPKVADTSPGWCMSSRELSNWAAVIRGTIQCVVCY